jgi:hypothetical protein
VVANVATRIPQDHGTHGQPEFRNGSKMIIVVGGSTDGSAEALRELELPSAFRGT